MILGSVLLVKCPWIPFISLNSWFFEKRTQLKAAVIAALCVALSRMFLSTLSTLCPRSGLAGVAQHPYHHFTYQSSLFKMQLGLNIFVRKLHCCCGLPAHLWLKVVNLQKCGENCALSITELINQIHWQAACFVPDVLLKAEKPCQ